MPATPAGLPNRFAFWQPLSSTVRCINHMKRFHIISVLYLVVLSASAGSVQPPEVDWRITVPATIKADHVKTIKVGENVFKFEETPLSKIRQIVGVGEIEHAGDAAASQYWLCYSFLNQTVWFISHGEMGGPSNVLTQVQAVSQNLGCPELKTELHKIQSSFGWLGTSKESLLDLLGKPSGTSRDILKFFHLGTKPGEYNGEIVNWDVIGYVEVTIENNKVSSIYASHTTTY